ncbi:hypothetical protein N431DRAFT_491131 [Stipitochalara longipes BDJ]|nr:hypothetical protein N431DRAFT_491131 [Stipitochalara longipes BDJ]
MAGTVDRLESRNQQIRLRIESLEKKIPFLRPHEKWPTAKAVRQYQDRTSSSLAISESIVSPSGFQSKKPNSIEGSSSSGISNAKLNDSVLAIRPLPVVPAASQRNAQNTSEGSATSKGQSKDKGTKAALPKLADFPFPIFEAKKYTTFPQFSRLPAEIRIQIWEFALVVPRFIEAQFCTNYYQPAFINHINRHVLFSVCHESRAIALVSAPDVKSQKALAFRPHPIYWARFCGPGAETRKYEQKHKPNRFLYFNPERDTIFLRSLDTFPNELHTLMHDIQGIGSIQHLALPLEKGCWLPLNGIWHHILSSMPELKTVTFMIGSKEKTWKGSQRTIELRDVEQWFMDGRCRDVGHGDGSAIDVNEVGSRMRTLTATTSRRYSPRYRSLACAINFRVVAWKRVVRS